MIWIWVGLEINIDYTNGNSLNSTIALDNAKTFIEARTVPTVINGIATVTSIIIGFSGTTIGLLIKDILQDISKEKEVVLVILALPFATSLAVLYSAYIDLSIGGQGFLELAWRYALTSMAVAFFALLFTLLIFDYLNDYKKLDKNAPTEKVMAKSRAEEQKESEQQQLKREFQNRTL